MSGYNVLNDLGRARDANASVVRDPGASGVIRPLATDQGVCELVSATTETRSLESASVHGVGTILYVILKTDGGDVTLTGSDDGSVVFGDAGDFAIFMVTNVNGTHAWRTLTNGTTELDQQVAVVEEVSINNDWRVWDALVTNLAGADGTDDLGLVTGTYLTTNPTFNVTVATPAAAPFYARRSYTLPKDYVAGTDLVLTLNVTETVAATTASLDANAVDQDSPTLDIVATAAQSVVGAAATNFTFTITGTALVPGDVLDIRISITLTDVAATPNYSINKVSLTRTVLARTVNA